MLVTICLSLILPILFSILYCILSSALPIFFSILPILFILSSYLSIYIVINIIGVIPALGGRRSVFFHFLTILGHAHTFSIAFSQTISGYQQPFSPLLLSASSSLNIPLHQQSLGSICPIAHNMPNISNFSNIYGVQFSMVSLPSCLNS